MIVTENITVYKCEFCKKKLFVKHAMEAHEKYCSSNPANWSACCGCKHMEERSIDIHYYESVHQVKQFYCKKLEQLLYPMKVVKKKLLEKYPETFENQKPMPATCEFFSNDYGAYTDSFWE